MPPTPATTANPPIPTVDDLRVKLCYICQEEERYDTPSDDPPRAWTHPCHCTLIAHEHCLLKWIQTSQANESWAPNALKCPQCGAAYELQSDNPAVLRLIDVGNRALQKAGSMVMVVGAATVVGLIGTSIYVVCTGYGAWAVQKFIGKEMFDLLLGDDPSSWPWSAFINLPLLPFSLILTRFQPTSQMSPVIPILLAWPGSFSLNRKVTEYWQLPENARRLVGMSGSPSSPSTSTSTSTSASTSPVGRSWPPSPILFGLFGMPIMKMLYQGLYARVYLKVMGTRPPDRVMGRRGRGANNANNANGNNANGRDNGAIMNIGGDGPFIIRVRANIREEGGGAGGAVGVNGNPADQGAAVGGAGGGAGGNDDNPNAPAEVAEQLIEINASSLGRKVAGALLIPAIASWMGNVLLQLSRHSGVVRRFLAVRQPVGAVWVPLPLSLSWLDAAARGGGAAGEGGALEALRQMGVGARMILRGLWGNTKTFAESDPVWWRNTVGLGVFIVAKDCMHLFHLWLAKRELQSRKVKNRDFSGVDLRESDLVPEFLERLNRLRR